MALYGDGSNVNKTTDATASTVFGSASAVPQITVDGNQRISSISNVSITLDASINAKQDAMEERITSKLDAQHGMIVALIDRIRNKSNQQFSDFFR